jgi:hypothetical protein|tara:strand:- start:3396 stop:4013 length:618 start_codon:yes stop_codon:yes gene_type:complete
MSAGDTSLSICSDALILLGAAPISSFTEGSDAAQACDRLYPDLRDTLLSNYLWSWSVQKQKLARLSTAPIGEWKYAYQMPGDMLSGVIALFQSSGVGQIPTRYGWEIYGDQVFTNFETVFIDYQSSVNESKMPAYFIELLTYALASKLAFVITDQIAKADYFRGEAYGSPSDSGRGGKMRVAMNIDGRGKPPQIIEDYSLIDARY